METFITHHVKQMSMNGKKHAQEKKKKEEWRIDMYGCMDTNLQANSRQT